MPFSPLTLVFMYFVTWTITAFTILPLGNVSHAEAGVDLKDGGDPGAPLKPNLLKKAITTTWVSAIVFALLMAVVMSGLFKMPAPRA